jgi:hypothetical protein
VHWLLDLAFREDENRVRSGHAARTLSVLRHLALNLVRQERPKRVGIHATRLIANADPSYLRTVLAGRLRCDCPAFIPMAMERSLTRYLPLSPANGEQGKAHR